MPWPAARHRLCAPLAVVVLCATAAPAAAIGPGQTLFESGPSGGAFLPLARVSNSFTGSGTRTVSADGHVVVFESDADDLSAEDDNRLRNVFVRNTDTGATTLVNRATGAGGAAANADSEGPVISADGTKVAFTSRATNLVDADTNGAYDVFVRDLTTNTTVVASRVDGAQGGVGNDFSGEPAIAIDAGGHVIVAFESDATNLVSGDTNATEDVFVRDLTAGTTTLVSRATGPTGTIGNGDSYGCAISRDGKHVAFESEASNLDAGDTSGNRDVFVRHLASDTTEYASRATGGAASNGDQFTPSLDQDGSHVAFVSNAGNFDPSVTNTSTYHIYRRTLGGSPATVLVDWPNGAPAGTPGNGDALSPTISDDAGSVAFASDATNLIGVTDDNNTRDIFVRRLGTNATELASRADGASGALASGPSSRPSLSGDGTTVAFESRAANLSSANDDEFQNVYTRSGTTTSFISRPTGDGTFEAGGNPSAAVGDVSRDGHFVVFVSFSNALSSIDDDRFSNVYARDNVSGIVTLVSQAQGGVGANGNSTRPSISSDGSKVAFSSDAGNLVNGVGGGTPQIYVRDMASGALTVASRPDNDTSNVGHNGFSDDPHLSGNGNRVLFTSGADNLVPGFSATHLYVRDLNTNDTIPVDVAPDGTTPGDSFPDRADIDDAGDKAAFASLSTNLVPGTSTPAYRVYVRDLATSATAAASRGDGSAGAIITGLDPTIDDSGTHVAFRTSAVVDGADSGTGFDVYVRDLAAGTTRLASRADGASGAPVNDVMSSEPSSIDGSGQRVAFATKVGLAAADSNSATDIYVRDLAAGATELESRADGNGEVGNDDSQRPRLTGNACCVAFDSFATNLTVGSPGPDFAQVYLHGLGSPPAGAGGSGSGGAPTGGGSPAPVALADTRAPVLKLGGAKTQKLGKVLVVTATVDEAARVTATATVSLPRISKVLRFGPKTVAATAGKRVTIRLKIPAKARTAIRRVLAAKKKIAAKVTVRARDAAGNRSSARRTIRLKR